MSYPRKSGLLLSGKPITKDQAAQIIIRTSDLKSFRFKDKDWGLQVFHAFGIPLTTLEDIYDDTFDEYFKRSVQRYQLLSDEEGYSKLDFFSNHMISHPYGSFGWCSWSGEIFANEYNISGYPYEEGILEEWNLIAKTFPFLNLKFQMLDGPLEEASSKPIHEYIVKYGLVTKTNPSKGFFIERNPSFYSSETNITIEDLKKALSLCDSESSLE